MEDRSGWLMRQERAAGGDEEGRGRRPYVAGGSASLSDLIRDIPDFPRPGVSFKDITPLLADPKAFAGTVDAMTEPFRDKRVDKVIGIEARGFIIAAPVALALGAGFVPVRKAGKLPSRTEALSYALEYGEAILEIHADAIAPGQRVLVIDDLLATGGTAAATITLVERLGGTVSCLAVLIELAGLGGAASLEGHPHVALVTM